MTIQEHAASEKSHLDGKYEALAARRSQLLKAFAEAAESRRPARMSRLCRQLQQTNEFIESLERIKTESKPARSTAQNRYVVSSLFLDQCFRELTADQNEQFFFITGSEVDGQYVLDQKLEFLHQKRTAMGVVGNMSSTHRLLIKLEQFSHRLLAHFHSHPGNGVGSTQPSGTDRGFQMRLETAGYPTVAAIFSRDGYIRFFRLDDNLEVAIHGSGLEQIGKNTFRLTSVNPAER